MSSAKEAAVEYLSAIYANKPEDPYTNIWLTAIPGDDARDKGAAGAEQRKIEDLDDIRGFVSEWDGRRNVYYKAARFNENAEGTRIVDAQVFCFAWIDIDIAIKPGVAPTKLVDMVCDAMDTMTNYPSVIVYTGGGIQALWHFAYPIILGVTPKAHAIIENLNRNLARVFGGDPAPTHPAGGLRLPGTININRRRVGVDSHEPVRAKVLRLEPDLAITYQSLEKELAGLGVKLFKDKMGQWHKLSGEMSSVERAHAAEATNAQAGEGKAKTPDEWDEIILDMVRKGGRNVAMTKYAGKLIRSGISQDDCLTNIQSKIKEAVQRVRDSGGLASPPGKSEIMSVIRSVAKTEERHAVEIRAHKEAIAAQVETKKKRQRSTPASSNGRTPGFDPGNAGSTPAAGTTPPPTMPRSDPGGFFKRF